MGGVKLGFEIAAGFILFGLAAFLIFAVPGWLLTAGLWLIDKLRQELTETFRKQTFIHTLIGLAVIGVVAVAFSLLGSMFHGR